jgi:small subunit ribosomal protein S17
MSDKKAKPAASKATKAKESKSVAPPAPGKGPASKGAAPKGPVSQRKGGKPAAPVSAEPAAPTRVAAVAAEQKEHGFRRKIIGLVVGDKMNKTVTVEVIRKAMHPMYKKYVRERNKYKCHDEHNIYKVGDRVEIMEHRPISAHKRWLVTRLISRPVEA